MVNIQDLTIEFSARPLFVGVSFTVNEGDRIALVGKNGAGKSTLLKTVAGFQQPTSGLISIPRDTTVGYLPQVMNLQDKRTLLGEVELAFSHHKDIYERLKRYERKIQEREDHDSAEYIELIEKYTTLNEQYQLSLSDNYQADMERVLIGLGFLRSDFNRQTSEFSGGWRMRIELAKLLLTKPNVLLLDEPTNHLDIESIQWLEGFLAVSSSAVILVSHDRAFINHVTNRTIEIECGKIYDYRVSYDKFVELRKERREQQQRAYDNQQKLIKDTEDFIERFRYKSSKAIQVQSRIKQLERLERIEIDPEDNSMLRLKFPPAPRSGDFPLIIDCVSKQYGSHTVFSKASLTLRRGEKVAFVGKNGAGKTTLVRCIMGETDYTGTLQLGHNVKIGYFAQNQAMLLDENQTVFETIDRVAVGDIRTRLRDLLGAFMFGGEASDKKVKVLSGGERSRLAMIRLLLEPVNLLILDEPTNHLDMRSKDVLKEAIRAFTGTAIIVSHDREFLDGLAGKVYEFGEEKVREHIGGIYDFLTAKNITNLDALSTSPVSHEVSDKAAKKKSNVVTLTYQQRKELNRQISRLTKQITQVECEIAEHEAAIAILEQHLSAEDGASLPDIHQRYSRFQSKLNELMEQWTTASSQLDAVTRALNN